MNYKMKKILTLFLFLLFNFLGLYLGGLSTNPGVQSEWYQSLNQAPWTPPGYIFGIVWTLIGMTWSIFGFHLWNKLREEMDVYVVSWLINLTWSPLFFDFRATTFSGLLIVLLSCVIFYLIERFRKEGEFKISLWGYLYFFWLMIATSLNWYIIFMN